MLLLFFHMPILTEIKIQLAKRHIKKETSIENFTAKFGEPNYIIEGGKFLGNRFNLDVNPTDEVWKYNHEGIPYWFVYIVTADGISIKDAVVDRGW